MNPALVLAVLAALALRFLVPAGWMPNPNGAAGGSPIVICSAEGPHLAYGLDLPGPSHGHQAAHEHCLFAGFALVGGGEAAPLAGPPLRLSAGGVGPIRGRAPWRAREQYRRQAPRGPPIAV